MNTSLEPVPAVAAVFGVLLAAILAVRQAGEDRSRVAASLAVGLLGAGAAVVSLPPPAPGAVSTMLEGGTGDLVRALAMRDTHAGATFEVLARWLAADGEPSLLGGIRLHRAASALLAGALVAASWRASRSGAFAVLALLAWLVAPSTVPWLASPVSTAAAQLLVLAAVPVLAAARAHAGAGERGLALAAAVLLATGTLALRYELALPAILGIPFLVAPGLGGDLRAAAAWGLGAVGRALDRGAAWIGVEGVAVVIVALVAAWAALTGALGSALPRPFGEAVRALGAWPGAPLAEPAPVPLAHLLSPTLLLLAAGGVPRAGRSAGGAVGVVLLVAVWIQISGQSHGWWYEQLRYGAPLIPALIVLAGLGWRALAERVGERPAIGGALIALLALTVVPPRPSAPGVIARAREAAPLLEGLPGPVALVDATDRQLDLRALVDAVRAHPGCAVLAPDPRREREPFVWLPSEGARGDAAVPWRSVRARLADRCVLVYHGAACSPAEGPGCPAPDGEPLWARDVSAPPFTDPVAHPDTAAALVIRQRLWRTTGALRLP